MLQQSTEFVEKASKEAIAAAEAMALAMMCADLVEDLIPAEKAFEIASEHRATVTEEWKREVHSALVALEVLKVRGNLSGIA